MFPTNNKDLFFGVEFPMRNTESGKPNSDVPMENKWVRSGNSL
jgi:hypothetical protein